MAIVSKVELQRHFNLKPYRLESLLSSGLPYIQKADRDKGQQWMFDVDDVKEWLEQYEEEEGSRQPKSKEYQAEQTRKVAAQADIAEHKLALLRGEVVPIDAVTDIVARQYASLRAHLLSIPPKLAPLIGADNEELVKEAIKEALQELREGQVLEAQIQDDDEG